MFHFKHFSLADEHCAMKVGTDGVLLGAWAAVAGKHRLLDLGCGCGVVGLMLAWRTGGQASVTGVELDAAAADDARSNVAQANAANPMRTWQQLPHGGLRLPMEVITADVQQLAADAAWQGRFDSVVANPPYHEEDLLPPDDHRAKARHTAGGGLTLEALLKATDALLNKSIADATLQVILPAVAASRFVAMAAAYNLHLRHRTNVVTRRGKPCKRVLMTLSREPGVALTDELELMTAEGKRSADYAKLCADFYL